MAMEYKYKFSIIMSVYNVEKYIEEAIQSVINQDINFKENVQIILVNDGSKDKSEEICLKYLKMYKENILYIKKNNGGLSSAKNVGLKYRLGKYINFFDPDDIMKKRTLSNVYSFFEKNYDSVEFVTIPLVFFEAAKGIHPKYKYMGNKNRLINLDKEPYNFILSSAASFYKTEIFNDLSFDENMLGEEDTKFNFEVYEKNKVFGYVCQKGVNYQYRKRFTGGSTVDKSSYNIDAYKSVLILLDNAINTDETIPKYKKELIIYELRSRYKTFNKLYKYSCNQAEIENLKNRFDSYLKLVDKEFLITESRWVPTLEEKIFFATNALENKDKLKISDNGYINIYGYNLNIISDFSVEFKNMKFLENKVELEFLFYNYDFDNLDIVAKSKNNDLIYPISSNYIEDFSFKRCMGQNDDYIISKAKKVVFKLPLNNDELQMFIINKKNNNNNKLYSIYSLKQSIHSPFKLNNKYIGVIEKGYKTKLKKDIFTIKKFNSKIYKYNILSFLRILKKFKKIAWYRLFNKNEKKYILINDRPIEANDNGEALFKYINKEEKNLAKVTYYVLNKESSQIKRMKKIGKVIIQNSIKHKILFLQSKLIFSSHMHKPFYQAFSGEEIKYYADLLKYKFVWLQHGITINDISAVANKYAKNISYITISTKNEYKEFLKEKYLFKDNEIIKSGFSRYDFLHNNEKNIITCMPTWRMYLTTGLTTKNNKVDESEFVNSKYYESYIKILSDKKLYNFLKKSNFKFQFILHPEMHKYVNEFLKYENDVIKIIVDANINYTDIFNKSKLLITDYSSVFFDFSYLHKPIIYYMFDKSDFFNKHYNAGYFDYERDGFGDVIIKTEDVIDKVKYYLDNNFKMESKYKERVDNTFMFKDKNNSKRIIDYLKSQGEL